jgi:hypothetical protein
MTEKYTRITGQLAKLFVSEEPSLAVQQLFESPNTS